VVKSTPGLRSSLILARKWVDPWRERNPVYAASLGLAAVSIYDSSAVVRQVVRRGDVHGFYFPVPGGNLARISATNALIVFLDFLGVLPL